MTVRVLNNLPHKTIFARRDHLKTLHLFLMLFTLHHQCFMRILTCGAPSAKFRFAIHLQMPASQTKLLPVTFSCNKVNFRVASYSLVGYILKEYYYYSPQCQWMWRILTSPHRDSVKYYPLLSTSTSVNNANPLTPKSDEHLFSPFNITA